MLKIDIIDVMDKLLKIVHNMEHSRSQLKTYLSRISFSRSRLVFFGLVNGLSLRGWLFNKYQSSVQFNRKFKKFKFSGDCQVVTFKFTFPLVPIKLSQASNALSQVTTLFGN